MAYRIGQTIEGKEFLLKTNGKMQDVSKCSGCDCCEPCEFAEYPTEGGAAAIAYDLGIEDVYLRNTNTNQIIDLA